MNIRERDKGKNIQQCGNNFFINNKIILINNKNIKYIHNISRCVITYKKIRNKVLIFPHRLQSLSISRHAFLVLRLVLVLYFDWVE